MKQVKLVHCADVHLDMPFTSMGSKLDKTSQRRQDIKDTLSDIISIARAECADLLLVGGDLYEHEYVKKSTICYINDLFSSIGSTQVIIIPGNHDPFTVNSYYSNFEWAGNVHILTHEKPYIQLDRLNTFIYGVGFNGIEWSSLPDGQSFPSDPSGINILLAHGTVDLDIGSGAYNPMSSKILMSLGMDYIALGHFHNRQTALEGIHIYNPGSPEPLGFDEPGIHGIYVGTITKKDSSVSDNDIRFIRTNRKSYVPCEVNINGCSTDEQAFGRLVGSSALSETDKNTLLSITLKGYINTGYKVNTDYLAQLLEQKCFHVKIKDETAQDFNFNDLVESPGIKGLFVKKLLAKLESAQNEREKQMLTRALYYGMEALEDGKVEI